jgi:hypothetical protein
MKKKMAKIIDFYSYNREKLEEKRRQKYEEYYDAVYELMLMKFDEILPLLYELDIKQVTLYDNKTISYKFKDEE